jgi:hypothetical protein
VDCTLKTYYCNTLSEGIFVSVFQLGISKTKCGLGTVGVESG